MSRHVPLLTEVVLRAWGLDDPRVLPLLRAENQPGPTPRARAVRQRAQAAGWPPSDHSINHGRKAATAALRRLEGTDWQWNGDRHSRFLYGRPYRSRSGGVVVAVDDYDHDDGLVTIFDE